MDRRNWLVILLIAVAAAVVAIVLAGNGGTAAPVAEADTSTTGTPTTTSIPSTTTTEPRPPSSTLAIGASVCEPYQTVSVAGTVESTALVETSGIAASRTAPGVIWAHNDSGDNPNIYAIGPEGEDLGSFTIDGAVAFDWEDVAIGPGPDPDRSYLYVGDIGDNFRIRQGQITVYRVLEPEPASMAALIPAEDAITLHSPDGPHDFEALFVADESIYVATKDQETTLVYRTASPIDGATSLDLELVATLDLGAEVTAADVSWDGSVVAFRGYSTVWMWHRDPGMTIGQALTAAPCTVPSPDEIQGEALAFLSDGSIITVSEGVGSAIQVVPRAP
jgi:hypothetical protein